ncbi:hypothetical protein ABPG74_010821 [Tetrahymena malaccensis]
MVLISFTNIVVDEFSYGKRHPLKKYIYFLTHMHSDHYQGITPNWNFGPIYCSEVTKKLLLNKFPQLQDVRELEMNKQQKICLNQENKIEINVYLFDANHCPGSVMYMFEGYFGRILHTGDMRFNENLIYNNPILYPIEKRNSELKKISLQIDECIFDNTYCDPIFKFPKREKACQMLTEIIDKHKNIPNVRILICVDSVGKEELLVFLSKHYETLIVVNEQRYQSILCMDIPYQLFTTNRDQGWIEIIRKNEKHERMESKNEYCVSITCTGWANIQGYITKDDRNYLLPYSLHSNFEELELFVRSIYPSVLNTVVRNQAKGEKINNITQFSAYMVTLMNLKQRGVEFFQKNYIDFSTISKNYQNLMLNQDNVSKINKALGLELSEKDKLVEDTIDFQSKHSQIFKNKKRLKKGAQLADPTENNSICIDKYIEIKKSIELIKEMKAKSKESSAKSSLKKNSLKRKQNFESENEQGYDQNDENDEFDESYKNEDHDNNFLSEKQIAQQKYDDEDNRGISSKINQINQKLTDHLNKQKFQTEQLDKDEDGGDEEQLDEQEENVNINQKLKRNTTYQRFSSEIAFNSTQSKSPPPEKCEDILDKFVFKKIVKANTINQQNQNSIKSITNNEYSNTQASSSSNGVAKKKQIKIKISKKISMDKFDNNNNNQDEILGKDNFQKVIEQKEDTSSSYHQENQKEENSSSRQSEINKEIPVFRNSSLNKIFNQFLNKQ